MSWPSAVTVPPLAVTMPQMMLISVVLPAPLGPSRAKISPLSISRFTGFKASTPKAYDLTTPLIERTGFKAAARPARSGIPDPLDDRAGVIGGAAAAAQIGGAHRVH